jgi:hypothetical protein
MHIPKLTMDVLNGIAQFQAEAEELNNEDSKEAVSYFQLFLEEFLI